MASKSNERGKVPSELIWLVDREGGTLKVCQGREMGKNHDTESKRGASFWFPGHIGGRGRV